MKVTPNPPITLCRECAHEKDCSRPKNFPLKSTVKFLLKFLLKNEEKRNLGENGGKWGYHRGGWWGIYVVDPKGVANLCELREISENVGASM